MEYKYHQLGRHTFDHLQLFLNLLSLLNSYNCSYSVNILDIVSYWLISHTSVIYSCTF
jgi:hypothetical protein